MDMIPSSLKEAFTSHMHVHSSSILLSQSDNYHFFPSKDPDWSNEKPPEGYSSLIKLCMLLLGLDAERSVSMERLRKWIRQKLDDLSTTQFICPLEPIKGGIEWSEICQAKDIVTEDGQVITAAEQLHESMMRS